MTNAPCTHTTEAAADLDRLRHYLTKAEALADLIARRTGDTDTGNEGPLSWAQQSRVLADEAHYVECFLCADETTAPVLELTDLLVALGNEGVEAAIENTGGGVLAVCTYDSKRREKTITGGDDLDGLCVSVTGSDDWLVLPNDARTAARIVRYCHEVGRLPYENEVETLVSSI